MKRSYFISNIQINFYLRYNLGKYSLKLRRLLRDEKNPNITVA